MRQCGILSLCLLSNPTKKRGGGRFFFVWSRLAARSDKEALGALHVRWGKKEEKRVMRDFKGKNISSFSCLDGRPGGRACKMLRWVPAFVRASRFVKKRKKVIKAGRVCVSVATHCDRVGRGTRAHTA